MALTVAVCTFGMRSVKFPRKSTMRVLISPTTAACCVNCRTTAPSALSAPAAWGRGGRPRGRPPRGLCRGTAGGAADTEIRGQIKFRKLPSQQKQVFVTRDECFTEVGGNERRRGRRHVWRELLLLGWRHWGRRGGGGVYRRRSGRLGFLKSTTQMLINLYIMS